jgi:hypothetical protein
VKSPENIGSIEHVVSENLDVIDVGTYARPSFVVFVIFKVVNRRICVQIYYLFRCRLSHEIDFISE